MTVLSTPEDVANVALRRIGYTTPIGSLYEGSPQARAVLDIYAETVWALLRASDQEFSRKVATLALTGNTAPPGWSYEYLQPADCLRVRSLLPVGWVVVNPQPVRWDVGTSVVSGSQTTVIWSNVQNADLVYTTGLVTEPDWNSLFTEEVVVKLAQSLKPQPQPRDGQKSGDEEGSIIALNSDRDS
jgi:hypothetical protein